MNFFKKYISKLMKLLIILYNSVFSKNVFFNVSITNQDIRTENIRLGETKNKYYIIIIYKYYITLPQFMSLKNILK